MSTIPQLTMFPLYPGGPQVQAKGYLNANSSFYTQATRFTPAYPVNIPPTSSPVNPNTFYQISDTGRLSERPVSEARNYNVNLGFDPAAPGGLKQPPVPPVAPVIPNLYRQAAELLSITDLKFTDLMNQPEFRIPGIGMGLKVKTDGAGGVDSIAISPSGRGMLPPASPFDAGFGGPKRAEITEGATFKAIPPVGLGGSQSNPNPARPVNPAAQGAPPVNPFNALERNAGIFNLDRLGPLNPGQLDVDGPELRGLNPVLDRLYQLELPNQGLGVAGFDAGINAEQARQMAATNARFDVIPSKQFRENVAGLVSAASRQDAGYGQLFRVPEMDGKIPMAPSLPNASGGGAQAQMGFAGGSLDMGNPASDAFSKKSSGGYIPFQMQSGGQSFGGGAEGSMGGFPNPFAGQGAMTSGGGQQQPQQQRKPLRLSA